MKFDHIIGVCDSAIILEAEKKLTTTFTELAMSTTAHGLGSTLGGDIFLHQLITPSKQICDARGIQLEIESEKIRKENSLPETEKLVLLTILKNNIGKNIVHTAATDGESIFWSPKFVASKSKMGLRLSVSHEGYHIMHMHPSRRGRKNKNLWNAAIDIKTNFLIMEDMRVRRIDNPENIFTKELGEFVSLQEYIDFLKDPFNPPIKLETWNPCLAIKNLLDPANAIRSKKFYYAEPHLPVNLRKPESIYDYILSKVPICPICGKLGAWKKPEEFKKLETELGKKLDEHEHY